MKNKFFGILIVFVFCFIGIQSVKAERFDMVIKCGLSSTTNVSCPISIIDGEVEGTKAGCDAHFSDGDAKVYYKQSEISVSEASKCYKVEYSCVPETPGSKKYIVKDLHFSKTDATSNDAGKNIICPSIPLIDMCAEYNESNFSSKCPNKDADYKTFRAKCDLGYQDAMNYCDGKGDYVEGEVGASIEEIRRKAEETKEENKKNPELSQTNCSSLMDSEVAGILKNIFFIISITGVVILVFMMASDFIKAIASSDNDAMSKAFSSAKTRIIATIILLILPALVSFIIDLINNNTEIVIDEAGNKIEVRIGDPSDCNMTN